jgi:hypothetical protein
MNKYTDMNMARDGESDKCDDCGRRLTDEELQLACFLNRSQNGNVILCADCDTEEE